MYFVMAGIALLLLKYFEIGFVAAWSWWWVLTPFALAVGWWAWADSTGYTKRKAMEAMDKKKQDRIDRQRESLGLRKPNRRR
jgi:small Trp-rich protein